jgi:hypothetical protein
MHNCLYKNGRDGEQQHESCSRNSEHGVRSTCVDRGLGSGRAARRAAIGVAVTVTVTGGLIGGLAEMLACVRS